MSRKKWRAVTIAGSLAIVLAVGSGLTGWAGTSSAERPSVSVGSWAPAKLKAPFVKPTWSMNVDVDSEMGSYATIAEEGKVFAFAGKKLVALDAVTGKKLWTFGSALKPVLAYEQGTLYGMTADGQVFAVKASTGGRLWLSAERYAEAGNVQRIGSTVYVLENSRTIALEAGSGKQRWATDEPQSSSGLYELLETDGVVIRSFIVQGALSSVQIDGFDVKTGEKLWGHFHQYMPLVVKDGLMYSIHDPYPFADDDGKPDRNVTIGVFNVKTGAQKGSRVYSWKLPGEPPYQVGGGGQAFLDGNDLYVNQSGIIAKYDFWAYKPDAAPVQKWYGYNDASLLGTIAHGRMLFTDHETGELKGFKLANGQQLLWRGDNPAVQQDLYGKGLYIGQSDGVLHGIDFLTHQAVFSVKTDARDYGPTLKTGGTLVIQAEGKLLGVKLPASLK